MANKLSKDISGSVQEKRGMLYLVVSYKDTVTQKNKTKWLGLGLPAGSTKSLINKAVREAKNKFESEYKRFLDGYDDPTKYPLLQFINDWLDRVHIHKIQESTYYGYKRRVSGKMAKYFDEKITLADCKPRLIHGFYDYLREDGDSEQTILHYHNLLHTAFEYAIRQEILEYNPMDRVERPQPKKFVGDFYSVDEVKTLLEHAKEDVIYIPIVLAVYCGLRRSEALGLSWSNIDFENDKIFIGQKVLEVVRNGKMEQVISDEMKTESSRRSFKMIPEVKEILLAHKERQELYRKQFRRAYCKKYLDMVCVNPLGELIKPSYITSHFPKLLKQYGMRDIRFHDLRHPYVKHTTKIFSLRLMDFQAQAYPDARRKTRGACQLLRVGQSRSPVRPLCNRKRFSCLPPQSKMSWILYAISMRLSGYTSTRSISSSASSVVSVSASKIALDASFRLSCRACSSCFCFACANTAA